MLWAPPPTLDLSHTSHLWIDLICTEIKKEIKKEIRFRLSIFTQPLRSDRIWHKVNF